MNKVTELHAQVWCYGQISSQGSEITLRRRNKQQCIWREGRASGWGGIRKLYERCLRRSRSRQVGGGGRGWRHKGGTWASGGVSASLTKLLRPLGYVSCQPPPHRYLFTQVIDGSVNLQGRWDRQYWWGGDQRSRGAAHQRYMNSAMSRNSSCRNEFPVYLNIWSSCGNVPSRRPHPPH